MITSSSLPQVELEAAAELLQAGGLLIYPTETFWAIGCRPDMPQSIDAIYDIKGRFQDKPLPLLAANMTQAASIADLKKAPQKLLEDFWPGPLTLVLPGKSGLPAHLYNPQGKVAVRVTASPAARALTELANSLLTCSSANIQAHVPGKTIEELDQDFWDSCARSSAPIAICIGHAPPGREMLPSTILEPELINGKWRLHILRQGAVTPEQLASHYWELY